MLYYYNELCIMSKKETYKKNKKLKKGGVVVCMKNDNDLETSGHLRKENSSYHKYNSGFLVTKIIDVNFLNKEI